jgi:arginine N-succinyltransferase
MAVDDDGGEQALIAAGRLSDFRCAYGRVRSCGDGVALNRECANVLSVGEDDDISHVGRT